MSGTSSNIEFQDVPADWVLEELGHVASLKTGGSAPQGERYFKDGKHPFIRVQHFDGAAKYLTRWDLITDEAVKDYRLKLFKKDTILFPKSGASIMLEKRVKLPFSAYVVSHLCCVEPDEVENDFLFYVLKYIKFAHTTDGSTLPYLNLNHLAKRLIPVPTLPEQQCIAHVLSTVQYTIEQQDRLIKLTRELKSALMHKLFTGGLHGEKQKMTEIGPVPESWKVLPLDELLTRTQYGLSIRGEDAGKYGILRMTNQTDGKISTEKMQFIDLNEKNFENYRLKRKDILFNRTNSLELVGRTAIFDIEGDYVFASYLIRLNTNNERLDAFFLNHYLNWEDTQRRLKTIALRAVSQSNINATRLRSFQIPVPPLKEQAEIVLHVNTIINKIEIHQRKKQILEELFRALLNQLMTGQTRVNEIDLPGFS